MIAYAEHEFRLDRKRDDGASERDHLESARRQIERMGGKVPATLAPEPPPFPDLLAYIWAWFGEVSLGIASNGMAPAQITWRDVKDWCELTDTRLEPWEARTLVVLGLTRASAVASDGPKESTAPPPPNMQRRR